MKKSKLLVTALITATVLMLSCLGVFANEGSRTVKLTGFKTSVSTYNSSGSIYMEDCIAEVKFKTTAKGAKKSDVMTCELLRFSKTISNGEILTTVAKADNIPLNGKGYRVYFDIKKLGAGYYYFKFSKKNKLPVYGEVVIEHWNWAK